MFDVFASILNIPGYIGKAIRFAGMTVFAPLIIGATLKAKATALNAIAGVLMGIYATFWNLVILYNLIMFILNKRGK